MPGQRHYRWSGRCAGLLTGFATLFTLAPAVAQQSTLGLSNGGLSTTATRAELAQQVELLRVQVETLQRGEDLMFATLWAAFAVVVVFAALGFAIHSRLATRERRAMREEMLGRIERQVTRARDSLLAAWEAKQQAVSEAAVETAGRRVKRTMGALHERIDGLWDSVGTLLVTSARRDAEHLEAEDDPAGALQRYADALAAAAKMPRSLYPEAIIADQLQQVERLVGLGVRLPRDRTTELVEVLRALPRSFDAATRPVLAQLVGPREPNFAEQLGRGDGAAAAEGAAQDSEPVPAIPYPLRGAGGRRQGAARADQPAGVADGEAQPALVPETIGTDD